MRRFYELLRNFPSYEFHFATVKECLRVPRKFDAMMEDSFHHASQYDNQEPFHPHGEARLPSPERRMSTKLSDRLVCLIADGKCQTAEALLEFKYVDYEIDPLRTTGRAKFENGRSASSGGIDLLLTNAADFLPTIGEIKAESDATLFLALIQSLTYAIELVTPPQRKRLLSTYPGRFAFSEGLPLVDICIIQISPPQDDWANKFTAAVDELAGKILVQPFASQVVRRIACVFAPDVKGQYVRLSTSFVHSSRPNVSRPSA